MKLYQLLLIISASVEIELWEDGSIIYDGIKNNIPWSSAEIYDVKYIGVSSDGKLYLGVD